MLRDKQLKSCNVGIGKFAGLAHLMIFGAGDQNMDLTHLYFRMIRLYANYNKCAANIY